MTDDEKFQSTHPSWGATLGTDGIYGSGTISIHAPIVGCDSDSHVFPCLLYDFNPRTHRGVRRVLYKRLVIYGHNFNPRTHRGVRR